MCRHCRPHQGDLWAPPTGLESALPQRALPKIACTALSRSGGLKLKHQRFAYNYGDTGSLCSWISEPAAESSPARQPTGCAKHGLCEQRVDEWYASSEPCADCKCLLILRQAHHCSNTNASHTGPCIDDEAHMSLDTCLAMQCGHCMQENSPHTSKSSARDPEHARGCIEG